MPATSREEPQEEPEEDLLPLPITQENPSKDELLGLEEHADDVNASRDDADLDLDGADPERSEHASHDLTDVHADVMTFDDSAAAEADSARSQTELELPEDDAHFEDVPRRRGRVVKDDEPRHDERALEMFGEDERAFDDADVGNARIDRGVEGVLGEEVAIDEASLPAMDADTGGEFELTDLLSELGFGATRDFVVAGVHDVGPVTTVAVGPRGFCAGGASAVFFEGPGSVEVRRWPRPVTRVERAEDGFIVVDTNAVSHVGLTEGSARTATTRMEGPVDQLVMVGDQLIVRIGSEVSHLKPSGERTTLFRDVASIGASSSTLLAATLHGSLKTRRGHEGAITEHRLDGVAASAFAANAQIAACGPKQCLVRAEGNVLWVRPGHATQTLSVPEGLCISAACAAGLGFDFLVVLEDAARTLLAAPHAASAELQILADLHASFAGGVSAICWDEPSQEAIVAGASGVGRVRALAPH